jgi:pterin-4a-carbinolamine dehydratase
MNPNAHTPSSLEVPSPGLKAERVQSAPTADGGSRLKAERVQLVLRDLPDWHFRRGARRLARTYEMADTQQAARLLQSVAELGFAGGDLPEIAVRNGQVTFRLPTLGGSWIEASQFEMAKALEVRG